MVPETAGPEEYKQVELEAAAAKIRVRARRRISCALGISAGGVYPLAPLLKLAIAVELGRIKL
jgi:hypothetical protein